MTWWNKFAHDHELRGKMPVDTWTDLKRHMRKRFVQPWYQRDMIHKMHKITQGTRSVEDYFFEFESSLHRVQIDEHLETTMMRFLQGLRRDIVQRVETIDYFNLNEMFHKTCQVEQHVKEASTWQNRGQRGNQPPTYVQQLRQNFPADNQRRTTFEPRRNAPTTSTSQGSNQRNLPTQGNFGK